MRLATTAQIQERERTEILPDMTKLVIRPDQVLFIDILWNQFIQEMGFVGFRLAVEDCANHWTLMSECGSIRLTGQQTNYLMAVKFILSWSVTVMTFKWRTDDVESILHFLLMVKHCFTFLSKVFGSTLI